MTVCENPMLGGDMHLRASTLDDLLQKVFHKIVKSKVRLTATKGPNSEISGVCLELTQPRARLSRSESKGTIYSCIGEFLWYASKSNNADHMIYYLNEYKKYCEEDGTVWGAYGPRIFGGSPSQYEIVFDILKRKNTSRQAVIQIFDKKDVIAEHLDIPCTCTLQFMIRDDFLNLIVHMRSNDAYWGLPHDVFSFTMIQEILANHLGVKLGNYKHFVGSLHVYDSVQDRVARYLGEGMQSTAAMPAMPAGDPWHEIEILLEIEKMLRTKGLSSVDDAIEMAASLQPYWADMARLLAIFALTRPNDKQRDRLRRVVELQSCMSSPYYKTYIRKKRNALVRAQEQASLLDASNFGGDE